MKTARLIADRQGVEGFFITEYPVRSMLPYKFLYFRTEDRELLFVGTRLIKDHNDLLFVYKRYTGQQEIPYSEPVGAGVVRGFSVTWRSLGLQLETPEALRPRILELLDLLG